LKALINLIKQVYLWSLLRHMKHATNDFMTRVRNHTHTHTYTKPKSRTNIFNNLHDPLCSPHDSLDFIHLFFSSNPLATPGANRELFLHNIFIIVT